MYWKNKMFAFLLVVIGIIVGIATGDFTIGVIFTIVAIFAFLMKGDIFGDQYVEDSTRTVIRFRNKHQLQLVAIYKEELHFGKTVNGWCIFELWSPKQAREVDIGHLMYIHTKRGCYHFFRVRYNREGERLSYIRAKR